MSGIPSEFKRVTAAGAGGGLVSWVYSIMAGTTFGLSRELALPCCLILGAFSAVVAVYLLTPTDTKQVGRLLAYAALCGFMWKPIIDAAKIVVKERLEVASDQRSVDQALRNLDKTQPAAAPGQIAAAKASVTDLLDSSETLGSPELEQRAAEKATQAVEAIAKSADKSPGVAAAAIKDIEIKAQETDNPELAALAGARLAHISRTYGIRMPLGGASLEIPAPIAPPAGGTSTTTQ